MVIGACSNEIVKTPVPTNKSSLYNSIRLPAASFSTRNSLEKVIHSRVFNHPNDTFNPLGVEQLRLRV